MAYLGVQPTAGQYRKLDDISGSFNGSTVTFTTQVGGQNVTAGSAQSILVSLGGVIQSPGTNYSVSTNSITFVTAPAAGLSFFAILLGEAVNTGTPSDGTVTPAKLSTGGPSWNSSGNVILQTAGTTAAPALQPTGDTNTGIYFPAADSIGFVEGGAESARFDSSGRFLVGTSSARANFDNTTNSAALQIEGVSSDSTTSVAIISNANSQYVPARLRLAKSRGTSTGSNTVVQSGDLIGTVQFQGSDGTEFVDAASILAEVDGTPGANDMPGRLVFSTTADGASSPTERMRIANNGRLSVGSNISDNGHWMTNPGTDTSVLRLRQSQNAAGVLGLYYDGQPNNTNDRFLSCLDNNGGTARCHIQSNGGIANYQANNSNLSDLRTKKDISPAADTWDCLKEWEIVNYRYKDQPDDAALNLGVIAQQVAESCPEVVTVFQEEKEATETEPAQEERLGVKEQQMMWMAIKALQEAQLRIETLEAEVAALKAS